MMGDSVLSWLFETKAVRVCPEGAPFWYTSGKLGPFYINTHFLYGSQEAAEALKKLDGEKKGPLKSLLQFWKK